MEEKGTRMELDNNSKPRIYSYKELDRTEGEVIESTKKLYQTSIADPNSWLAEVPSDNILLTTADALINWARASSVWRC